MSFYQNVSQSLRAIGKDWEWLQAALEISQSTVNGWRNGHKRPGLNSVDKIARFLNNNRVFLFSPRDLLESDYVYGQGSEATCARFDFEAVARQLMINEDQLLDSGFPKSSLSRIKREKIVPSAKNMARIIAFIERKKKIHYNPLDLIYFPKWGEKGITGILLKKKETPHNKRG